MSRHTSSFVHYEFRMYDCSPVVCPLSPSQVQHHNQRHNGDNTTRGCSDPRIFDSFCKGVEPCKPGLCRHV